MTSKIIVAIVAIAAAVLSLAAPVAVEAQALQVQVNEIGATRITYSGFTAGVSYYSGGCHHATAHPASCSFDSMGVPVGGDPAGFLECRETLRTTNVNTSGLFVGGRWGTGLSEVGAYTRIAAYSDSACTTEVASQTYTTPATYPTWRARDVTSDSATIYIEDPLSTHYITYWDAILEPGNRGCVFDGDRWAGADLPTESPTQRLSGLSSGTTYTYSIYKVANLICTGDPVATVTFTTEGSGPPGPLPEPPTGVDGGEPTTAVDGGSVTISWANPGDPDIATYEYSLRQAGGPAGEWTTVPGSNADTTSVTIDLATGEAIAVNNATPPMAAWTIHLRARDTNGNAGGIFTTTVNAAAVGPGTVVPALPLAGLVTLALVLFLGGQRQRNG